MSPLELVLERIEGVRRSGAGFSARCPAHEDRHASLSVSEGEDGRALIRCHAGCSAEDVCAALGLDVAELFPREERTNGRGIVARYPYVDEEGGLLFEAVRFSPKDFRQRRPDGRGGWDWRLGDARRVLYRLPELLAAVERGETVYIVEGEKDVHALERVGLVATCNPMGAGKWRPEHAETLRGAARVVVIPDADKAGRSHAEEVAGSLASSGVDVRVVDLAPEGPDGFDPSDYFQAATSDVERAQARELLEQLVEAAPVWTASASANGSGPAAPAGGIRVESRGRNSADGAEGSQTDEKRSFSIEVLTARALCAMPDPPRSDELLGPLVMRGCRTIIGGHTGEGKSTYTAALVAAIVKGEPFLEWQGAGGCALVLDLEQGLRTVKRVLREAGLADSDDVDYARIPDGLALDKNVHDIAAVLEVLERKPYDVVVLDPHYKAHRGESNEERPMVDFMRQLDAWRTQFGFALVLPCHYRKPSREIKGTPTIHDLFGSSAIVRGAEVVIGLERKSDGYSRLHFFKDREGELPVGEAWGLLFDREQGFRRDPKDGEERDLAAELVELFTDGEWRTVAQAAKPKSKAGIGANRNAVLATLKGRSDLFASVAGAALGRSPQGVFWNLLKAAEQVEQVGGPAQGSLRLLGPLPPRSGGGREQVGDPDVRDVAEQVEQDGAA